MNKKLVIALIAVAALSAPGIARAGTVTDWNKTMVDALYASHTTPQPSTRIAAIVQTSVFDAVNGISRRYEQFHPEALNATPPPGHRGAQLRRAPRTPHSPHSCRRNRKRSTPSTRRRWRACPPEARRSRAASPGARRSPTRSRVAEHRRLHGRAPPYVIGPLPFWQPTPPGVRHDARVQAVRGDDTVGDDVARPVPAAAAAPTDERPLQPTSTRRKASAAPPLPRRRMSKPRSSGTGSSTPS